MSDITLKQAIQCMESLCGTLNDHDNECLRILLETALASQAQQEIEITDSQLDELENLEKSRSMYSVNEYRNQVRSIFSMQSQAQQTEQEPYAYDVPTTDGTELAYAIYFTKYNNPLPEGAIPLYASQQESQLPDISTLKRIAKELKTYIPEADEYKGKFIHKVWAKEIELALPPAPEGE